MVTGDSKEEMLIFRDKHTDRHFIIIYIYQHHHRNHNHRHHHHHHHNDHLRVLLLDPLGESPPGALLSHASATIWFSNDDGDDEEDCSDGTVGLINGHFY